jgi:signal recognition particle subunit SRP19
MKKMVLWLANIDSSRSRTEGRKIPKGLAIKEPDLSEMKKAAEHLNLQPDIEPAQYPRDQGQEQRTPGRILVQKEHSKPKTLKLICDEIRRIRQAEKQ